MSEYEAKFVLNWDDKNLKDSTTFIHRFGDEELKKSLASGDIFTWLSTIFKVKEGLDITSRLSESGADRIDITVERVKNTSQIKDTKYLG